MIEVLLSVPTGLGCLVFAGLTTAVGLTVYFVTCRLHARRQNDAAMEEVGQATSNLFRVVGWLFTLLLSLTFTDVVGEMAVTETAIEREATAISDINHNLRRFGREPISGIKTALVAYTESVVDGEHGPVLTRKMVEAILSGPQVAVLFQFRNDGEEV